MIEKLNSIESEKSLLGSILNDPTVIGRLNGLRPEHFYNSANQIIFNSIQKIISKGKIPDLVTVITNLKETGKIDDVGGAYYVTELSEDSFTSADIRQNEQRIIEHWKRRKLYQSLTNIKSSLINSDSKNITDSILAEIQKVNIY